MTSNIFIFLFALFSIFCFGCSGIKVVDPNRPNNKGTLQLDYSKGTPQLVETYTCTIVSSSGKRLYATGKSEEEARDEVIAQCQDQTLISFCKSSKVECEKN